MKTEKQKLEETMRIFTKKQLAELYLHLTEQHINFVKYMYDNYPSILRDWEKTQGNLRIGFLGEKK